jgi:hypothetical protein
MSEAFSMAGLFIKVLTQKMLFLKAPIIWCSKFVPYICLEYLTTIYFEETSEWQGGLLFIKALSYKP